MANCNDVLRVKDRLLVATEQGVKSIGILQNFSDPALWSTIFSTPVKHLAASANAVYLNVAGGSTAVVGTWRIAAGLVEKAGANDFARVDLLALKQLQTGVSGAVYGFNDLTLLQFDDNASSAPRQRWEAVSIGCSPTAKTTSGLGATAKVLCAFRSMVPPST